MKVARSVIGVLFCAGCFAVDCRKIVEDAAATYLAELNQDLTFQAQLRKLGVGPEEHVRFAKLKGFAAVVGSQIGSNQGEPHSASRILGIALKEYEKAFRIGLEKYAGYPELIDTELARSFAHGEIWDLLDDSDVAEYLERLGFLGRHSGRIAIEQLNYLGALMHSAARVEYYYKLLLRSAVQKFEKIGNTPQTSIDQALRKIAPLAARKVELDAAARYPLGIVAGIAGPAHAEDGEENDFVVGKTSFLMDDERLPEILRNNLRFIAYFHEEFPSASSPFALRQFLDLLELFPNWTGGA